MVQEITTENFNNEVLSHDGVVVVDFFANWCGPCRMLAPVFEEISDKYEGKAVFVKIDIDENEESAIKYGITSIPNVIAFKNGKAVGSNLGFVPAQVLENFVKENL